VPSPSFFFPDRGIKIESLPLGPMMLSRLFPSFSMVFFHTQDQIHFLLLPRSLFSPPTRFCLPNHLLMCCPSPLVNFTSPGAPRPLFPPPFFPPQITVRERFFSPRRQGEKLRTCNFFFPRAGFPQTGSKAVSPFPDPRERPAKSPLPLPSYRCGEYFLPPADKRVRSPPPHHWANKQNFLSELSGLMIIPRASSSSANQPIPIRPLTSPLPPFFSSAKIEGQNFFVNRLKNPTFLPPSWRAFRSCETNDRHLPFPHPLPFPKIKVNESFPPPQTQWKDHSNS